MKGKVALNGDIFGEVHMENLTGPIHLHTSVTDLEMASLPGDMTLNDDDLRVTEAKGQVRVTTHSKNVDLSQIYGDTMWRTATATSPSSRPGLSTWRPRTTAAKATWS